MSDDVGDFRVFPFDGAIAYQTQVAVIQPKDFVGIHVYYPGRPLSSDPSDPNPRELSPKLAGRANVVAAGGRWLLYRTPDSVFHLYDVRLPFSASNPSVWAPVLPADAEWRWTDVADGWLLINVYRSTARRADLLVFDLEDDRNPVPVYTAADVADRAGYPPAFQAAVSSAGLLWTVPDGSSVFFQPTPFGSPGPVDLGPGTIVMLSGDYGAFVDGAGLYGFDATRPFAAGQNPVDLGDVTGGRPVLVGSRLAWTRGGQVYTADLSDPTPSALWISDTVLDHTRPVVGGGGVAWIQCDPGGLGGIAGCLDGRFRGVAFWSSGQPGSATVLHDGADPIDWLAGSALGVAWVEGAFLEEEVHFFDPGQPVVADVNPVRLTHNDTRDNSLVLTADALYWYTPFWAHSLLSVDAQTLAGLAAGTP